MNTFMIFVNNYFNKNFNIAFIKNIKKNMSKKLDTFFHKFF